MAEPFFMHHVNQMFAKVNHHDLIIRFINDGWLKMIELGATNIWEHWGDKGSLCHAWSSTPAYDLVTHCLGIKIVSSGGKKISIEPHLMDLTHASGTVPTEEGLIKVGSISEILCLATYNAEIPSGPRSHFRPARE